MSRDVLFGAGRHKQRKDSSLGKRIARLEKAIAKLARVRGGAPGHGDGDCLCERLLPTLRRWTAAQKPPTDAEIRRVFGACDQEEAADDAERAEAVHPKLGGGVVASARASARAGNACPPARLRLREALCHRDE